MAVTRLAAVALAIVACAWFALAIRQAHDTNTAAAILSGANRLGPGQATHVSNLLSSAATLNPDRQVDVLRGELLIAQRQYAAARQTLSKVTQEEPKNLQAWVAYASASPGDQADFDAAVNAGRRLDPRGTR